MPKRIPDADLLEALTEVSGQVEGTPTFREMNELGPYSAGTYKRRFGSWHKALEAAGIEPTYGIEVEAERAELIEELRAIAEEVGETPTQNEIRDYGDYPLDSYHDEFESFVSALEAADLEPTQTQYNFSDVEPPEEKQGTQNVRKLRDSGPTPGSKLPGGTNVGDKRHGMWKFTITIGSGRGGGKDSVGGMIDPVYYLPKKHAPEHVMRLFFEANPQILENLTYHGLIQHVRNHKTEWADIAKEFLPELMEEQTDAERPANNLVFVILGNDAVLSNCFEKSIATALDEETTDEIENIDAEYAWGFTDDDRELWQSLSEGDLVLFSRKSGVFTHLLEINTRRKDWNATTELWIEYEDGIRTQGPDEPWPYLIFGDDVRDIDIRREEIENYLTTDLTDESVRIVGEDEWVPLREKFGSVDAFIRDVSYRSGGAESPASRLKKSSLEPPQTEPPLTVDSVVTDEQERERRKSAFRSAVREVYGSCAFCGQVRKAPDGSSELEAAHIYPKSEGGPDIVQNGIALCRLHHWAFDSGWFRIDTEYCIHVRDRPGVSGYDEFEQFDGEEIFLPAEDYLRPHPKYLEAHRKHVDFHE